MTAFGLQQSVQTDSVSCHYVRESSPIKSSMMEVQWEVFGPTPVVVFELTNTVGTIQLLVDVWRGLEGGIVYVLPLRVEPYIGQTHDWPAAGELLSLYHCANLAWG